jgi:hypothetical protein
MTDTLERVWAKKVAHDDGYRLVVTDVPNEILQEYVRADLKPKVKQLEWQLRKSGVYEAKTIAGVYEVWPGMQSANWYWRNKWDFTEGQSPGCENDGDEAKAAAQADYERRIWEALE